MVQVKRSFAEAVNWRKFVKIISIVAIIMLVNMLSMPKTDWWFQILIIGLVPIWLLLKSHTDYRMNKDQRTKTLHNIKEIRAEKLKRLNKRFKW